MQTLQTSVCADGIVFGEGPRWHDGRLWFSDVDDNAVKTLDSAGNVEVQVETEHPSGLGWLPDGTLLISTLLAPTLKRWDATTVRVVEEFADRGWSLNDMVVGPDGRAYVDLYTGRQDGMPVGEILLVTPGSPTRTVATGLQTPNGLAVTPDGSELRVNETSTGRVLAYSVGPDGVLSDQRVFADLGPDRQPDGLCLDEEGAAWVASLTSGEFLRVLEGGAITHRIETPGRWAVAPALGGPDRRTLYLMVSQTTMEGLGRGESTGRIETVRVDVPGAGWP